MYVMFLQNRDFFPARAFKKQLTKTYYNPDQTKNNNKTKQI